MQNIAVKCPACDLTMVESSGVHRCVNWDGVQPQETEIDPKTDISYPRRPSPWDLMHLKYDKERFGEWHSK